MSNRQKWLGRVEARAYSVRVMVEAMRQHLLAVTHYRRIVDSQVGSIKRQYAKLDWKDQRTAKNLLRRMASTLRGDEKNHLLSFTEEAGQGDTKAPRKRGRPRTRLA